MTKRIMAFVLAMAMAIVLSSAMIPAFAAASMPKQRETEHFVFYSAEQNEQVLDDLAEALEGCYARVTTDLGKSPSGKTSVNIYPNIQAFHTAVGRPDAPDSSVGEAKSGSIYMVSPLQPGPQHNYDSIITVAVHEFVHIVVEQFGRPQPTYLNEGLAAYEAGQGRNVASFVREQISKNKVPSLTALEGYVSFSEGLYEYGYAYIDFVARSFGFDKITELLEGKPRAEVLGKSEEQLEQEWRTFLANLAASDGLQQKKETEHFIFNFAPQDRVIAERLGDKLEKNYTKLTVDLKKSLTGKTTVDIYPDIDSFHKAIGKPGAAASTVMYPSRDYRKIRTVSPGNPGPYHKQRTVFTIIEVFCAFGVTALFKNAPDYLFNGVACYECGVDTYVPKTIQQGIADNSLPDLTQLEILDDDHGAGQYWYAYVDFVVKTFGYDDLISLLEGKTLTAVSDESTQQLNEKWTNFLKNAYQDPSFASGPSTNVEGIYSYAVEDGKLRIVSKKTGAAIFVAWYDNVLLPTQDGPE